MLCVETGAGLRFCGQFLGAVFASSEFKVNSLDFLRIILKLDSEIRTVGFGRSAYWNCQPVGNRYDTMELRLCLIVCFYRAI